MDLRKAFEGVFSFESVPESVSKLRSFKELLQLSVSAMRLARLFRARLEVDEVVCMLAQECVDEGVPGWFWKCGVAGVDKDPVHLSGHEYRVWYFLRVKGDLMKFFRSWFSLSSLLVWLLVSAVTKINRLKLEYYHKPIIYLIFHFMGNT